MVPESTLQLTFKKLILLSFGVISKNIHNYPKRLLECSSLFSTTYLRPDLLIGTLTKAPYYAECKSRYENPARH